MAPNVFERKVSSSREAGQKRFLKGNVNFLSQYLACQVRIIVLKP